MLSEIHFRFTRQSDLEVPDDYRLEIVQWLCPQVSRMDARKRAVTGTRFKIVWQQRTEATLNPRVQKHHKHRIQQVWIAFDWPEHIKEGGSVAMVEEFESVVCS